MNKRHPSLASALGAATLALLAATAGDARAQAAAFTLSSPDLPGNVIPRRSSSTASAAPAPTSRRRWSGATCRRERSRSRCRSTIRMRRRAAASGTGPSTTSRRLRPACRKAPATRAASLPAGATAATPTSLDTGAHRRQRQLRRPVPAGGRPAAPLRVHALRAGGRQGRGRGRHPEDRHRGALQLRHQQGRRPGVARQGLVHRDVRALARGASGRWTARATRALSALTAASGSRTPAGSCRS